MRFQNRRFQPAPWIIGLFICLGVFFLYHDLSSLSQYEKQVLERSLVAVSKTLPRASLELALVTKDSQSQVQTQLQDELRRARLDLGIHGALSLIDSSGSIVASTDPRLKLGDPLKGFFWVFESPQPATSDYEWKDGRLSLSGAVLVDRPDSTEKLALVTESDPTPLVFRMLNYLLHYLILALGLAVLFFFFDWRRSARSHASIGLEKSKISTFFHETSDGVILLDAHGIIQTANPAAAQFFAESPGLLPGRNLLKAREGTQFIPLEPDQDFLKDVLKNHKSIRAKAKIMASPDHVTYVSFSASPWKSGNRHPQVLLILQDITADIIREQELRLQQTQLREENLALQEETITDPLTKTLNKRYLFHFLSPQNIRWASIEGCSLLVIDLDNFKAINDAYGHQEGDRVLVSFAAFLKGFFRRSDKIIRYGGDEFIAILPRTDQASATRIAQNMMDALKKSPLMANESVSVSIGIAQIRHKESGREWLKRADRALLEAKRAGKDRALPFEERQFEELEILN